MAVTIQWDDAQKSIMVFHFEGRWTWDEFFTQFELVIDDIKAQSHPLDATANFEKSAGIASNALGSVFKASRQMPKNWNGTLIIGATSLIRSLMSVFQRVYPQWGGRYSIANNLDHARALIAEKRAAKT